MSFSKYWKKQALVKDAARQVQEAKASQEISGRCSRAGTLNASARKGSISRRGSNRPLKTQRLARSRGLSPFGATKNRGMWHSRLMSSFGFSGKLKAMIDFIGDLIVVLSASIAAGSGLSAWRLLRRVKNLEMSQKRYEMRVDDTKAKVWDMEKMWHDQAVFNSVVQDELDALSNQPAPKQNKKMGTPKPNTANGLLYGRTHKGP